MPSCINYYCPLLIQYQPHTDPVPPSVNQYRLLLNQYHYISTSTTPYWPSTTKCQPVSTYTVVAWGLQTSAQFTLGLFQLDVIIESGKWLMDRLLWAFVDLPVFISWYVNIVATLKRHASLVHFGWKILDSKYSTSNGKKNIAKEPNHQFKQSYNLFSSSATSFTSYIQWSQKLEISKNKFVLVCLVW